MTDYYGQITKTDSSTMCTLRRSQGLADLSFSVASMRSSQVGRVALYHMHEECVAFHIDIYTLIYT